MNFVPSRGDTKHSARGSVKTMDRRPMRNWLPRFLLMRMFVRPLALAVSEVFCSLWWHTGP